MCKSCAVIVTTNTHAVTRLQLKQHTHTQARWALWRCTPSRHTPSGRRCAPLLGRRGEEHRGAPRCSSLDASPVPLFSLCLNVFIIGLSRCTLAPRDADAILPSLPLFLLQATLRQGAFSRAFKVYCPPELFALPRGCTTH